MRRRNPWLIVWTGAFALIGGLIAGVAGYWLYANQLPVYPAPTIAMPVPNAYDDYEAAGQMCQAAGGAQIPPAPTPLPAAPFPVAGSAPPGNSGGSPGFFGAPPEQYLGTSGGPYGSPGGPPGPPAPSYRPPLQACDPGVPLAQVEAVVRRNRPALARLRQGFRKKYRSPPVVSFNQLTPELAQFRRLAQVLVTEGKLAEREGRSDDAARSYLDCLRLGTDVPRGGVMIHGNAGIAIQSIGLRPLQQVASRLDGPTAAAAAREMVRLDARAPSVTETLANHKEAMTAGLLEMFRHPPSWRQVRSDSSSDDDGGLLDLLYIFTPRRWALDRIRGYMDALIAGSRRPYYARPAPRIPNDLLSRMLLTDFELDRFKWDLRDAQWRITELRLAVRAYRDERGVPPPSLQALVPAYLPAVPQDPFAPKPLVYRQTPARVLIYSRGPDGKDDGGKDLGSSVNPESRGDIVSMKPLNRR